MELACEEEDINKRIEENCIRNVQGHPGWLWRSFTNEGHQASSHSQNNYETVKLTIARLDI
jgi:hypothetical protein